MKKIVYLAAVAFGLTTLGAANAGSHDGNPVMVSVTAADVQSQFMALVLANQSMAQGAEPRVLLCGPGAEIATRGYDGESLEPSGMNPQDLLNNLIEAGVTVEVCAVFLPNTEYTEDDLIDGIGTANPREVGAYMADPAVRFWSN